MLVKPTPPPPLLVSCLHFRANLAIAAILQGAPVSAHVIPCQAQVTQQRCRIGTIRVGFRYLSIHVCMPPSAENMERHQYEIPQFAVYAARKLEIALLGSLFVVGRLLGFKVWRALHQWFCRSPRTRQTRHPRSLVSSLFCSAPPRHIKMFWTRALALLALTSGFGLAHPPGMEEETSQQADQPHRHISQCHDALQEPQFIKRTFERRQVEFDRLRKERGLETRSLPPHRRQADKLAELLHKDHQVHKPFNKDTRPDQLFADDGACMMAPLVSEGPLYVSGEQVRRNLTDYETGVPMSLDIQVVDAKTCKPVHNVAVDIWSCNTTGIYSGVWALPRNPVDYDRSVINTTALRGIQFTDDEGVVNFDTFFPGHYEGRAVHIHGM